MKEKYLLGIDIGTESSRVVVFNQKGEATGAYSTLYPVVCPKPGWAEQNPQVWWKTTISNIKSAVERAKIASKSIVGIGVCGQMHAPVSINREGELLSTSVQLWCDKRSARIVEKFKQKEDINRIFNITANPPLPAWNGFKIKWIIENQPHLYEKTWKFLTPKDYINYKLTGQACTDFSDASGTYLMDIKTRDWSAEVMEKMKIELEKLPPIHPSSAVIGKVTTEVAKQSGLLAGTPVVGGGADMLCTLLGAGITEEGRACDTTGTASIISFYTREPILNHQLMNLHHVLPGWISFGILDSGGGSLKWFKDEFCKAEIKQAEEKTASSPYSVIDRKAKEIPVGCKGLIFFPYLLGERTLGSAHSRGILFGLAPLHNKDYIARAIMEGVCFDLRQTLELVQKQGARIDQIRTIGGGAKSELWSQIKADIYCKPVITFKALEGGALGAAILAGVGVGMFEDEKSAAEEMTSIYREYKPQKENSHIYNQLFKIFKNLHDVVQLYFENLSRIEF